MLEILSSQCHVDVIRHTTQWCTASHYSHWSSSNVSSDNSGNCLSSSSSSSSLNVVLWSKLCSVQFSVSQVRSLSNSSLSTVEIQIAVSAPLRGRLCSVSVHSDWLTGSQLGSLSNLEDLSEVSAAAVGELVEGSDWCDGELGGSFVGRWGQSATRCSSDLQWWQRFGWRTCGHLAAMWLANSPQL